jgi:peptidoglycan/LPS O-acetylase OafA/YrhL
MIFSSLTALQRKLPVEDRSVENRLSENRFASDSSTSAVTAKKKSRHIPALDGVRGIAIVTVMAYHLVGGGESTNLIVRSFANLVHGFGWAGVDLFFVLSGFLITGILLDSQDDPHFFRNFYARRTLRIFPLYYGVLAVCFGILPLIHPFDTPGLRYMWHNQLWLWLYGGSILDGWTGSFPLWRDWLWMEHLWSLSVEEHFYLVWPAVVFFCARKQILGRVCVIIAASVLIARLIGMHAGVSDVTQYAFTPLRCDSLVIGALVAVLARRPGGMPALIRPAWAVLAASFVLIVALTIHAGFPVDLQGTARYFTLTAFFFAASLVLLTSADPKAGGVEGVAGRMIAHPLLRFFGRYSYGLYVLYWLMQPLWNRLFRTSDLVRVTHSYLLAGFAHLFLCVGCSLGLAMLSFHFYEQPFLRLKRYFEAPIAPPRPRPRTVDAPDQMPLAA